MRNFFTPNIQYVSDSNRYSFYNNEISSSICKMPLFDTLNDTYCQLCERFKTRKERDEHLFSDRRLHREAHG